MTEAPAFHFGAARTANRLVAGVPAAARLAAAFAAARPGAALSLAIGGGGTLAPYTRAEIARLAPGVDVRLVGSMPDGAIPAVTVLDCDSMAALLKSSFVSPSAPDDCDATLDKVAREIIRSTAKPSDGMIARHLNRPLSQAISAQLLRPAWVRPGHATALTALAALAMLVCLLAVPTLSGLAAGAVLFQIASVLDGVDGEIARATQRSSRAGASLDSLVDAFTNCAFLAGAGANFAIQGEGGAAIICAAAAGVQITGLSILGRAAWLREGIVHFDGAKAALAPERGGAGQLIKDLTSRDFYCLAFMLASLAGVLAAAMTVFLVGSAAWLAFVVRTAMPRRAR